MARRRRLGRGRSAQRPAAARPDDEATGPLDAGAFTPWRQQLKLAIAGQGDSDVPCGSCSACCRSSQFVLIEADETDALAHIPSAVLFPAPRMPAGNLLMGYDEQGRCPMLVDDRCSVYQHRPRACRVYDCRVFTAAGTEPDEPDTSAIAVRVRRWRFAVDSAEDEAGLSAVRAAADFLRQHERELPDDLRPATSTHRALQAFNVSAVVTPGVEPSMQQVAEAIRQ